MHLDTGATQPPACVRQGRRHDKCTCTHAWGASGTCSDPPGRAHLETRTPHPEKKKDLAICTRRPQGQDARGLASPLHPSARAHLLRAPPREGPRSESGAPGGSTRSNLLRFLILGRGWRVPGLEPLQVLAPAALRAALPPPPRSASHSVGAGCWVLSAWSSRVPAESWPSVAHPGKAASTE